MSSSTFTGIHRLLLHWRGSIWKSIYPELLVWLGCYFAMSISYRYFMSEAQRIVFEDICVFFFTYSDYIPITFMLGFYVTAVFNRWHDVFDNLGWIDTPALLVATYVRGTSEQMLNIRRNVIRYMVLTQALVFRDISTAVQRRFPTMNHLVTAGLMTPNELKEFDSIVSPHVKFWTPIQWAFLLLRDCRDKGVFESDITYMDMLDKIGRFRLNVLTLTLYDWVPMPLVYTQVVNIAVRTYFLIALFARQYMIGDRDLPNKNNIDLYVPIMTILQFLFYIGWMKVAEVLINPLGEDDDDFETNWVIDRNLQVGFAVVDNGYGRVPVIEHDAFWGQQYPEPLYTAEAASRHSNAMVGSCSDAAAQEDALLLQARRHRLMSTVALPLSPDELRKLENGHVGHPERDSRAMVQVYNHNPARRMSVCATPPPYSPRSGGGHIKFHFGDILKRKLSRRDAVSPRTINEHSSPHLHRENPRPVGEENPLPYGEAPRRGERREVSWSDQLPVSMAGNTGEQQRQQPMPSDRASVSKQGEQHVVNVSNIDKLDGTLPEVACRLKSVQKHYSTASSSSSLEE